MHELLQLMAQRRSIRKYQDKQVSREDMETILQAGTYAPDAFCCAENMVLMASALGLSSCIVARGEETFDSPWGQALLRRWEVPENYIARCFVLLGYCRGDYPKGKPRKPDRWRIIE